MYAVLRSFIARVQVIVHNNSDPISRVHKVDQASHESSYAHMGHTLYRIRTQLYDKWHETSWQPLVRMRIPQQALHTSQVLGSIHTRALYSPATPFFINTHSVAGMCLRPPHPPCRTCGALYCQACCVLPSACPLKCPNGSPHQSKGGAARPRARHTEAGGPGGAQPPEKRSRRCMSTPIKIYFCPV